jgi:hypothetical protein
MDVVYDVCACLDKIKLGSGGRRQGTDPAFGPQKHISLVTYLRAVRSQSAGDGGNWTDGNGSGREWDAHGCARAHLAWVSVCIYV